MFNTSDAGDLILFRFNLDFCLVFFYIDFVNRLGYLSVCAHFLLGTGFFTDGLYFSSLK